VTVPNPGYPAPTGLKVFLSGGIVVPAEARFVDVILDCGVPTPRFAVVLPNDLDMSSYKVDHLEAEVLPPGTIIMFEQVGNAQENAERIVELSRRAAFTKLMMSRKDQHG
jgi:hypothetical protein